MRIARCRVADHERALHFLHGQRSPLPEFAWNCSVPQRPRDVLCLLVDGALREHSLLVGLDEEEDRDARRDDRPGDDWSTDAWVVVLDRQHAVLPREPRNGRFSPSIGLPDSKLRCPSLEMRTARTVISSLSDGYPRVMVGRGSAAVVAALSVTVFSVTVLVVGAASASTERDLARAACVIGAGTWNGSASAGGTVVRSMVSTTPFSSLGDAKDKQLRRVVRAVVE